METEKKTCDLCPRHCAVDRSEGQAGYCGQTDRLQVARAALHMWEEPCISGTAGSGTIFFSGCSLHCVFCQNWQIANGTVGKEISVERLAKICLELQDKGANNINLVTASHFIPQVAQGLRIAKAEGLRIPVVYNTGSYETVGALQQLEGLVDIYLPDLKYKDAALSSKYSHAPDYFEVATQAIEEMVRQVGEPVFSTADGKEVLDASAYNERCEEEELLIRRGVIVRHLLLPGCKEDSKQVLDYLYQTYGDGIFVSIMNQFTPLEPLKDFPELNRKVTEAEYEEVVDHAIALGMENAFIQEGDVAEASFIPDFSYEGV